MNHEAACLNYLKLARIAHDKGQWLPRNRLMLLAAITAARAGWLDVAERSRGLLIGWNPRHVINSEASVAQSLNEERVRTLIQNHEKQISYERAEHLLSLTGDAPKDQVPEAPDIDAAAHGACLDLLDHLTPQ
jgi:hypothetical protein